MRKYLCIFIFIFGGLLSGFSQNYYNFNWTWARGDNGLSNSISVIAEKADGTSETIISFNETSSNGTTSGKISFNSNSKVLNIVAKINYVKGGFGSSCSNEKSFVLDECGTYFGITCVPGSNPGAPSVAGLSGRIVPVEIVVPTSIKNYEECSSISYTIESSCPDAVKVAKWSYVLNDDGIIRNLEGHGGENPIIFEASELSLDPNDYLNKTVHLKAEFENHPIDFSDLIDIKACPPELIDDNSIAITNQMCFDDVGGSVSLTFKEDIAENSQMRFFVYEGTAPESSTEENLINENPNFPGTRQQTVLDPRQNLIQTPSGFSGVLDGIPGSSINPDMTVNDFADYFIVYQVVDYSVSPAVVTSGQITPKFTISRPSEINISIPPENVTQPTCSGETGSVTLIGTGGGFAPNTNTPLEYGIQADPIVWQSSPTFSNLSGGNYIFLARSSQNCISELSIEITIASITPLTFSNPNSGRTSSNTSADGFITFNYDGGTPNYSFKLEKQDSDTSNFNEVGNPSSLNNTQIKRVEFAELEIGTYRITITDANNCTITSDNIEVTSDPIPELQSPQTDQITCFGGSNGRISVEVSNFTSNYRYQWTINGIATSIQTGTAGVIELNNLNESGDYLLKVSAGRVSDEDFTNTNNPDNYAITPFLLNDPGPIVIEGTVENDVSCNGSDDGSIVLSLSEGTAYEYTFELTPIESDWIALIGDTITNLAPGFYRVTVRNENGCESAPSASIFIDEPEVLSVSENTGQRKDVTTNGGNDGEISIEITGGTMPYSFEWSGPNGFTSDQQNLVGLTAGDYQVTVTDANNCTENLGPINITEPGPLGITSLIVNDVLCKGDATGSITAEVSGTPPFTFVWNKDGYPSFTGPNQAVIGGLTEGTFTLELSDSSGDPSVTASVVVTEPLETLTSEVIPTDVSCFNGNDGQITINAMGGTAPYQFAIDDGFGYQSANTFINLLARTYTVTVQDDNGCFFETTVDIGEPDAITIDTANTRITNATTTGGSDGAIDLEVIGGTGTYSYEWYGPNVNGIVEQNLAGLIAGRYQVTVTDSNGCTFLDEFIVGEPGPLSITNIQEFNVNCYGESTGRITTTVTGNGNITFEWRNVATNNIVSTTGKDLTDVSAGTYTLTIADETANPPVTSIQITINEPEILSAVVIPSEVSCFGGNDGALQINVSGGTPPFAYALDGINFQNNNRFSGLVAGTYDVTIRDNNNCELISNEVLIEPQELGIIIDQEKNLTAANTADGALSITVFGGTPPYSYQWVSDTGFTSTEEDISNLEGGNYNLVIRDANNNIDGDGCYFTRDFTIAEPGELLVTLAQTVFLECNGDDFAELTINVQGGVAPYTYEWYKVQNGSNSLLSEDLGIIGNLTAGIYLARVIDANAVSVDSSPINVIEPDVLEIILDGKADVLCEGEATGSIAISVAGGTAPYQYIWDNGETTEDLVGLFAGEYNIEVVDANGCYAEMRIVIDTPSDALRIANATVTDASEYQSNDGSIELGIVGGAGSYDINWTRISDNTFVGDNPSLDNLSADRYEVTITDANGCSVIESYVISQPDIVEATVNSPTCAGASDGSISLLVNKGNGVFSYSWNTGDTTNEINELTAGSYTVTINGLDDGPITRAYELIDPLPLSVDLGEDRVLCDGQQLELDATVTDPTATYLWSSDNGFSSIEPRVILTEKGDYSLIVESENGCTAQGNIFLDVSSEEISAEFAMSSQVFVGEPLILVDISYPLPDAIDWILPEEATVVKSDTDEAELVFSVPGEYEIGIIAYRGPCTAQQTKIVLVLAKDGTVNEETEEFNKKIVEDFILFPNPTNGQFNTKINLTERGNVSIRVFSFANNALIASEKARGESSYNISMDISGKPAGVYAVVLETPYGTSLRKLILK